MNAQGSAYKYLEAYLTHIRAKGRYAFTLDEAKQYFKVSDKALRQNIFRLKSKKRIASIRQGFYAVIIPEYSSYGMLPPGLFIDDMMQAINKKYYVGLLSAAALHGAAHQQPMEYFVVTEKPALRDIATKELKINFLVKKGWAQSDITQKKTDAGYIKVSSPELTALDLLFYDRIGLNKSFTVIQELTQEMQVNSLAKTAKQYPQASALQRLGYLLEYELQNKKLAACLEKALKNKKLFPTPLFKEKIKKGEINHWKVIVNGTIEGDL